ncbi:uncharacterized protein L969DRAFT_116343 [Mixia osmundae IAM 14324]|uniref:uncharacterized protein n=1 Tax=Mixia osmundae (strain CBS 9802 / IAM 14324 / JCM 22182 / KY 12970) TaxID=764103 RepID=UPI0004A5542C|nr:uncharacterized protein L969DRAFT_116343 [Mixia osmundae IAM 14324]KEI41865.1 hypothetical protein L969DRAFT_116343 [Mixia osmundae IAM 14324]
MSSSGLIDHVRAVCNKSVCYFHRASPSSRGSVMVEAGLCKGLKFRVTSRDLRQTHWPTRVWHRSTKHRPNSKRARDDVPFANLSRAWHGDLRTSPSRSWSYRMPPSRPSPDCLASRQSNPTRLPSPCCLQRSSKHAFPSQWSRASATILLEVARISQSRSWVQLKLFHSISGETKCRSS